MKVRVLPCQPHSLGFGGFEIQMLAAIAATKEQGIDVAQLNPWSTENDYQILHLWGLEESHLLTIIWAKRSNKKVVLTALLPYINVEVWFKNLTKSLLGLNRNHKKILSLIDHLVVVNEEQAETATQILGFPRRFISVVPSNVGDQFFNGSTSDLVAKVATNQKYLICTGNICGRKNQLVLAAAAIEENVSLLLVGAALAGEEAYADKLLRLISGNQMVNWIPGLPSNSSQLVELYNMSSGFCLVSLGETQPLSALEAVAVGKPLLLSDQTWARQSLYSGACLVNPKSVASVRRGIRMIIDRPGDFKADFKNLEACRNQSVGAGYGNIYLKLVGR